jgi:hypothetical protein
VHRCASGEVGSTDTDPDPQVLFSTKSQILTLFVNTYKIQVLKRDFFLSKRLLRKKTAGALGSETPPYPNM